MASAKQVQLRGGSSEEHLDFTGASREITIDTTLNTIRVHDGYTKGGHVICKKSELDNVNNILTNKLNDIQTNIGTSHNHDNLYSKLAHNHDDVYSKLSHNHNGTYFTMGNVNGYYGINMNGNDTNWFRTTKNGLLPYQSGGYSSIGTSTWQFNEGWFNTLNAHTLALRKNGTTSRINFAAQTNDPGYIEHYESNNTSRLRFVVSDDNASGDEIQFGVTPSGTYQNNVAFRGDGTSWFRGVADFGGSYISIGGRRIYIQSSQPSGARTGDVWFQI